MADTVGTNGERKEFNTVGNPNVPGKLSHSLPVFQNEEDYLSKRELFNRDYEQTR
jgi:hypothetical protein